MSRHWKIVDSHYDKESGKSFCHVRTNIGDFYGRVKLHKEDSDVANSFDGQRFAEMKCRVQYAKKKQMMYRERAIGARNAYNALLQNYDKSDPFMIKLERQVKLFERDAHDCAVKTSYISKNYKKIANHILDTRRKMRKKIEND